MNPYSEGLRHGYEDQAKAVLETLSLDVSDAEKVRLIRERCETALTLWVDRERVER